MDWRRFRVHLEERYAVSIAFYFIGYVRGNERLYDKLRSCGYELVFKEVVHDDRGKPKGNVDADLVLKASLEFGNYEGAVLVASDGDYYSLVRHLRESQKLVVVLSPKREHCSRLLRKEARHRLSYLDRLRDRLQYKRERPLSRGRR